MYTNPAYRHSYLKAKVDHPSFCANEFRLPELLELLLTPCHDSVAIITNFATVDALFSPVNSDLSYGTRSKVLLKFAILKRYPSCP